MTHFICRSWQYFKTKRQISKFFMHFNRYLSMADYDRKVLKYKYILLIVQHDLVLGH